MGVSNSEILFSVECDEPKTGKILRTAYNLEFTMENLQTLYEKSKRFNSLMGIEIPTHEHFVSFFLNPEGGVFKAKGLAARIDDFVGIFWLTDINYSHPPLSASIHYTFFDRRHKGRINLCRAAILYCFETYGFERLWTKAPLFYTQSGQGSDEKTHKLSVMSFVERIGFRKEGRLKNDMLYKGKKFDSILFALNRDETLNGEAFKKADLKYTGANQWEVAQTIQK